MSPKIAPIPEAIIPENSNCDGGISPLITVPSTRLAKINFVASSASLPKLRKKRRIFFLTACFFVCVSILLFYSINNYLTISLQIRAILCSWILFLFTVYCHYEPVFTHTGRILHSGIGYRVSGIGYRVSGIGYRVSGIGYRDKSPIIIITPLRSCQLSIRYSFISTQQFIFSQIKEYSL